MHVRKGDMVKVISGDDKGKVARVLRVIPESGRVVVEGVNMVFRHMRRSQKHPQGGRIQKEASMPAGKVMLFAESAGRPVRVGSERDGDRKVRVGRSGSTTVKIDDASPKGTKTAKSAKSAKTAKTAKK